MARQRTRSGFAIPYRREGSAVGGAGSVVLEGFEVQAGAVAFVAGEAVDGILLVERLHEAVSGDLGDDAGGGNGETTGIASDDVPVGAGESGYGESVDQGQFGEWIEGLEGLGHGAMGGSEDVKPVDLIGLEDGHADAEVGEVLQGVVESFAFFRTQLFGIVEIGEGGGEIPEEMGGKIHCRRDHGTGQGTASGFIHPRNMRNAAPESGVFDFKQIKRLFGEQLR